jgi:lipoprotein-anchoring transpeptidase ErfK/SrfK
MFEQYPDRDWILTRILWLEGLEEHNKNSKDRYIYIHGTPDSTELGKTGSKGCIRVKNKDMVEIFNLSHEGDEVNIIG